MSLVVTDTPAMTADNSPALFAGYDKTPSHCVEQFVNVSLDYGFIFPLLYVHRRFTETYKLTRQPPTSRIHARVALLQGGEDVVQLAAVHACRRRLPCLAGS